MMNSVGSITLKGFIAFQNISEIPFPIKKSMEMIKPNKVSANNRVTKIIFNTIHPHINVNHNILQ